MSNLKGKILVVDDTPSSLKQLRGLLKADGYGARRGHNA